MTTRRLGVYGESSKRRREAKGGARTMTGSSLGVEAPTLSGHLLEAAGRREARPESVL